ncbi:unnamed protein product [Clonostachys solani]|uniref:Zn(2)-C6 fungal-type domain-containing protein n=1 Tax=Clonostachys solani TaxID=160281 RepID=A0A9N9ZRA1_9HYPO|nr:unnamed protein product [Clonostachys solani]
MPPRRSHKKSRAGCRRCKVRKIKVARLDLQCDEVHPRCGNCVKHGVPCDFEAPEVADELAPVATPVSVSTVPSTPIPMQPPIPVAAGRLSPGLEPITPALLSQPTNLTRPNTSNQADRLMELRLMHQYTNVTAKTLLNNSPEVDEVWQRVVPNMAFEGRQYLADAILSVAALHLRSENPQDKALVRASHAYTASTLAEYCASLEKGINAENAEALFLTATLIAFQSVASRIFAKDDTDADPDDPSSRYALPLPWFHAFQGVKTIVASSWLWIRSSSIVKAVIDSQPGLQLNLNPSGVGSFFGHLLEGLDEELATEDPHMMQTTGRSYTHAVCVLNWAHRSTFPAASLSFPSTVARRYVELVEAKRPRALAILACFFALLKRMDDVWWLTDVSRREVMGLVGLFESGSKWWRHLEWPIRIALWDGTTIPPDIWGHEFDAAAPAAPQGFVSHIELMADLMGQAPEQLASAFNPIGDPPPPLTAESPD